MSKNHSTASLTSLISARHYVATGWVHRNGQGTAGKGGKGGIPGGSDGAAGSKSP